ncbi:MAG: 30S ribosomal protein S16 [Candidatus Doudnabacteria bacterium]|nr:30S ribosomal protein S16 [Candidatus Doudnabacteria bacterium]
MNTKMLTIRLQRTGKKKQADFRIVLAEKTFSVSKKFQEILGTYNPHKKAFKVNEERVKYWISQHAGLSATVHNLFVSKNLMEGGKVKAFSTPKKPAEAPVQAAESAAPVAEVSPQAESPAA